MAGAAIYFPNPRTVIKGIDGHADTDLLTFPNAVQIFAPGSGGSKVNEIRLTFISTTAFSANAQPIAGTIFLILYDGTAKASFDRISIPDNAGNWWKSLLFDGQTDIPDSEHFLHRPALVLPSTVSIYASQTQINNAIWCITLAGDA